MVGPGIPVYSKCSVPTEVQPVAVQTWFYWSDLFIAPPPAHGTRTKAQLTQGGDREQKGQMGRYKVWGGLCSSQQEVEGSH